MRVPLVVLSVAALAAVPSAFGKGPDTVRICGADRCVTLEGPAKANQLALLTSGFESRAQPRPLPFYTVELTSSRQASMKWSLLYVPSAPAIKVIRADFSGTNRQPTTNAWVRPGADALAAYAAATADVKPYPASPGWIAVRDAGDDPLPWKLAAAVAIAGAALAALVLTARRRPFRRATTVAPE